MRFGQEILNKLGESAKVPFDFKSTGPILITEGDGVVAYRIACRLLANKYPSVRVGVRDISKCALSTTIIDTTNSDDGNNAEIIHFDWNDETTYEPALKGIGSVYIALPHIEDWENKFKTFIKTAKSLGCHNFVKLSFAHALVSQANTMSNFATSTQVEDPFLKVPLVQMHRTCDMALMKMIPFNKNYVILFASHFMSNPAVYQRESIIREQKFVGASAGHDVNYVSPNDCAEVAIHALLEPKKHHHIGYTIVGPSAVKDSQVAEIISKHLSKPVQYVDEPLDQYAKEALDTDWGPGRDVAYLEYVKALGAEEGKSFTSSHDIVKTCGHPAQSFEDYLKEEEFMTPQECLFRGELTI